MIELLDRDNGVDSGALPLLTLEAGEDIGEIPLLCLDRVVLPPVLNRGVEAGGEPPV